MSLGRNLTAALAATSLAACGGGSSSNAGGGVSGGGSGGGVGGGGTTACSVSDRQDWVLGVMNEWYLFPDLLDTTVNKASYSTVQDYIDALVAPARAQNRDRYFTYITSKSEEEALINSGSSAGFGIRLGYDSSANRVFVLEAYENAPAFGAGIDRGTELLAIGTTSSNLQSVSSLMASGGPQAVSDALGPSDPGVSRVIQFRTAAGTTVEQSITKADYSLDPISDRYGVRIIDDGGKKVGYLNLRTFIVGTSDRQLVDAFQTFSDQGVTEVILDLRYNGGGLVRIAELMGDLMRGNNTGKVFSRTTLRSSKSDRNETDFFEATTNFLDPQTGNLGQEESIPSINPTKIAFIGRGGTASASELVANSMIPYLGTNTALIGTNTFGKPVGQYAFDRDQCDDRLRLVAFKTENADGQGEYFSGLASVFPNTCRAADDISLQLGDPAEASVATALDFLAGRTCTAISESGKQGAQSIGPRRDILQPAQPNAAQHRIPGLY